MDHSLIWFWRACLSIGWQLLIYLFGFFAALKMLLEGEQTTVVMAEECDIVQIRLISTAEEPDLWFECPWGGGHHLFLGCKTDDEQTETILKKHVDQYWDQYWKERNDKLREWTHKPNFWNDYW